MKNILYYAVVKLINEVCSTFRLLTAKAGFLQSHNQGPEPWVKFKQLNAFFG